MSNITISHKIGPTVFDYDTLNPTTYLTLGIKYTGNTENDIILAKVSEDVQQILSSPISIPDSDSDGMIVLTDEFFTYLRNNSTKIEAIKVSLENYHIDYREQKLKTLKTKSIIVTADQSSLDELFDTVVKELYYEFGSNVIDLYSVLLAPKSYKIIDNIPVEYRNALIRVKK